MPNDAKVELWGRTIGAVSWVEKTQRGVFQYAPEFALSGIQPAPLMMPLRETPYEFPELSPKTFKGLPGMLADSLPDKFGNALIDAWLANQSRNPESFNPVERLCYIGKRGMGALEFAPTIAGSPTGGDRLDIEKLVRLSNEVLNERAQLSGSLSGENDERTMRDILRVGTSAGGARAKAVLAWNRRTGEFRSGQVDAGKGYEHWLMKFDGIANNRDKELADPKGFGKIEYAYYLMATEAGVKMSECRLHHEGGRSHFMTRRFDRTADGGKLHMQSLCAMAHYDFNRPEDYSYEQALHVIKKLKLPREDLAQQVLRAFFNVAARNQDDHVKNIAFLMDREGRWNLSPAFDVSYAHNPAGNWTQRHQMSIRGKRDGFSKDDLFALAELADIKKKDAASLLENVTAAVARWDDFAAQAGVPETQAAQIKAALRLF